MIYVKRAAFLVYLNLDPVPGEMHTKESAESILQAVVNDRLSHYNPHVSLAPASIPTTIEDPQKIPRADLTFFSRRQVKQTYNQITDIIDEDGHASVLDLYRITGRRLPSHFRRPHYWGWDVISQFGFEKVDDGYLLVLPQIKHLSIAAEPADSTSTEGTNN